MAVLDTVLPVFALMALGSMLKRVDAIDARFIEVSDRLIYYVFFPGLLFWKIGKPGALAGVDRSFVLAVLAGVFAVFVLCLLFTRIVRMPDREVGSFSQACYRFSTYVGMATALSALGDEGARLFGLLIGFCIPFINVLAVSSLIWFARESSTSGRRGRYLLTSTVSNPLILACGAGMIASYCGVHLPGWLDKTLALMSFMALPLALICIGGSLGFAAFNRHIKASFAAACFKLIALPAIGYGLLTLFEVQGIGAKVAMIYFALPTSPNNYILSAQLDSDTDLATASIVLSTLLSLVSLSAVLALFVG